ncbi:indole-3-glycerol phosphate synthase [Legionella quinlivanii]|uniref:Indole-3-glycerol phosphate synthase n=1 Tax=Legionella quinlivanii TaxID=45073 RepID=A0A364LMW6_9GAMM|nr:indole-3-glycerol phosphate synthase TrpC [Legionella quinlivanii]RAP38404.1 indole-3-glycerol phosphate synthase [Legionella quinlivanii]
MSSVLDKIAEYKRQEVEQAKRLHPLAQLREQTSQTSRDFVAALQSRKPSIIAEIKKASPSKGVIREDFNVAEIAGIYEKNGASCLSVLTDEHFFMGKAENLQIAKAHSTCPALRKDFIIDSYQVDESRALGADCILLIVAILDDAQLLDYCQQAQALNMAVLVESHTLDELQRAIKLPTPLMGINNRSLHNFKTDIQTTIELSNYIPADKLIITESGINTHDDILKMQAAGIHHFLIGESLMRSPDIGKKLREFLHQD